MCSDVRGAAVRESLDIPAELRRQLHAPAGLPIGAGSPAEIAIAILAEFVAEGKARPAGNVVTTAAVTPAAPTHPETAVDPVCGMEVVATDATPHLDVDGERVYFCCERCRSTYAERLAADVAAR